MKRVLIITYYWPPTGGSGVQRWVKFAKYLPSQGWQPVIYTPLNPEQLAVDKSLLGDIPPEAEIIKTRIFEPYELYRKLTGKKAGQAGEGVNPLNSQKKNWKQRLAVWLRGNLFVPDPRVGWVRPSVSYLTEYLKQNPVDVVVTTGPPQSMHLIGLGLKKALGIKWIADFRDPWTEMFYFKHLALSKSSEKKHHAMEQSVLDAADAVISVTPLVRADFQAKTRTPVELITNGFDEDDFGNAGKSEACAESFRIVHTGLFASDGNPLILWDVLADKCAEDPRFREELQIRLSGKTDPEIIEALEARGLGSYVSNKGYIPHNKVVSEQRNASILMLPLRQEPEYRKVLPGKIFEYLAARRPVLGIGQPDGAAATVLRDTRSGEMLDWDDREAVRKFIDTQWELHLSGEDRQIDSDIEKYTRRALTAQLVELLERI